MQKQYMIARLFIGAQNQDLTRGYLCNQDGIKIKHTTLLEGETFIRNKHKIAFSLNKMHIFW